MAFGASSSPSSIGRFFRGLGIGLLLLAILVALAPTLASKTPLGGWLIGRATAGLPISVEAGSLSLGWFAPASAENVVVRDADGKTLAQIAKIDVERTLLNLVLSRSDLGKIRIERPIVDIAFTKDTSNLERVFKQVPPGGSAPPAPSSPAAPTPRYDLKIVDGTIRVVDEVENKSWQIANFELSLSHEPNQNPALKGSASGSVVGGPAPGSIVAEIKGTAGKTVGGMAEIKLRDIPASLLAPWVRRAQPELTLGGKLKADAIASWYLARDNTPVFLLRSRISGDDIEVSGEALAGDRLLLQSLEVPLLQLEYTGTQIAFECKDLRCDVGVATAVGRIAFDRSLLANLGEPNSSLALDIDLAELSRRIPKTMSLHPDVRLTAGRVKFDGATVVDGGAPVWTGTLNATEIRGMRGAAAISWADPLSLNFKIRQTNRAWPDIQNLECQSRFVNIVGSASATEFRLRGHVDLGQLAAPLGQFVDLGRWGLAGQVEASLVARRPEANLTVVDANAAFDRFQWGPWKEDRLDLKAAAQIYSTGDRHTVDKSASLRITSGGDVLDVALREPAILSEQGRSGSIYAKLDGDLGRWQRRLDAVFAPLGGASLSGSAKGQIWVDVGPKKIDVQSIVLGIKGFGLTYGNIRVSDPDVKVQASMIYDADAGSIALKDSQFRGQGLVVHATKLNVDSRRGAIEGQVVMTGDLGAAHSWFAAADPGGDVWAGALAGEADFVSGADRFDVSVKATIKNATFGKPGQPPRFSDPKAQFVGKGRYDAKQAVLRFDDVQLTSALGAIGAKAAFAKLDTTLETDIAGTLEYDLAQADGLAKAYLGASAQVRGRDRREFRVVGPLRPKGNAPGAAIEFAALQGGGGFSWQSLVGYGAEIGPANANAKLGGGWLRFDPILAPINQGKLRLEPAVRLDAWEMLMPAGPVVENAKITPAMCASALGYALPLLADVAQVDGEVSLVLDGARVPFGDPAKSDVRGVLRLHHAKVGPGPLVTEIAGLLKNAVPYSVIRDNQVRFRLEKGRVHHENLELILPDNFVVRTNGSVGLDGSLDMIAEIPFPTKLLGNIKLPIDVARNPIRLPVAGTVDRPRIDSRGLQDALKAAGRDAIGDLLNKGLDKLFRPKN